MTERFIKVGTVYYYGDARVKVYFYYILVDKHNYKMNNRILFNRFEPLVPELKLGEIGVIPNRAGYPAQYVMFIGEKDFDDDKDLRKHVYEETKKMIHFVVWGNFKEVPYKTKENNGR